MRYNNFYCKFSYRHISDKDEECYYYRPTQNGEKFIYPLLHSFHVGAWYQASTNKLTFLHFFPLSKAFIARKVAEAEWSHSILETWRSRSWDANSLYVNHRKPFVTGYLISRKPFRESRWNKIHSQALQNNLFLRVLTNLCSFPRFRPSTYEHLLDRM